MSDIVRNRSNNQHGFILMIVMLLLLVVAAIGLTFLRVQEAAK